MKYTVKVKILNKTIAVHGVEADNEYQAENKVRDLIIRKTQITSQPENPITKDENIFDTLIGNFPSNPFNTLK